MATIPDPFTNDTSPFANNTLPSLTTDVQPAYENQPAAQKSLWTMAEEKYFKNIQYYRNLFKGNHKSAFILPNDAVRPYDYIIINYLGDFLSETWRRFMFRKFPTFNTENKALLAYIKSMDLIKLIVPACLLQSYAGRAVLKAYYSNVTKKVCWKLYGAVPGEYTVFEYMDSDANTPVAVNYYYIKPFKRGNSMINAIIRERHALLFNKDSMTITGVSIVSTAHEEIGGVPQTREYDWNEVWAGSLHPPLQSETLRMTQLPCVIIDNVDRDGDGIGDSDYTESRISVQKNLNKVAAIRQIVIDLSEFPQLVIPPEYIDSNGVIDWNKVRFRIGYDGEDGTEIKVINWTGNLENSDKQWQFYREEFFALTGLSPALVGLSADSEARTGKARRFGLVATEAEVSSRRAIWDSGLRKLLSVTCEFEANYGGKLSATDADDVEVVWAEILPGEIGEISQTVLAELNANARSVESAVSLLPLNAECTPEWLSSEIDKVKKQREEQQALETFDFGGGDNGRTKKSSSGDAEPTN